MDALDWEEIWNRLKGMLWSAGALGFAGLCAGLWIYGLELRRANAHGPALYQPSMLDEAIRTVVGSLRGSYLLEVMAMLAWFGAVLWIYLIPQAASKRRLRAALALARGEETVQLTVLRGGANVQVSVPSAALENGPLTFWTR